MHSCICKESRILKQRCQGPCDGLVCEGSQYQGPGQKTDLTVSLKQTKEDCAAGPISLRELRKKYHTNGSKMRDFLASHNIDHAHLKLHPGAEQ